jgi:hypothetical protein
MDRNALLKTLRAAATDFVDGTPDGYKILHKIYPAHVYDAMRRKIAVELGGKEIAKILDAENNKTLEKIRSAVGDLYDGRQGVYAPIHDFWSFIEMVLHIKKKELPELITARNVTWETIELPLETLHFTWMPFLEQHEDVFGPKPWYIASLQKVFFQKPELLIEAQDEQKQTVGERQHKFNGRLYRTLLQGGDTISCYIGTMEGPMPVDYWVSAGALKQFCLEVRGYAETDLEGFANGLSYLRTKLRNNSVALINYELFLRKDFPQFENSLQGILSA